MNNRVDAMSVENATTVNVRVFKMSDYRQSHFVARIEQIEDPDISLRDISLSRVESLRESF